jgi:hypothetical protein
MTPADFMNEIVVPTLSELRDERRSRRRAYLACIAVFHLKDHLKNASESGVEKAMRVVCGVAFDVVRGVCNGTKHVETDGSHVVAFRAGDDTDRPPARLGELVLDVSYFDDTVGGRDVRHGTERLDVYDCAKAVAVAYQILYPAHLGACDLGRVLAASFLADVVERCTVRLAR